MSDATVTDEELVFVADRLGLRRHFTDEDGCQHEQQPRAFLLDGNGMLAIIEAMRERGYDLDSETIADMSYASFRKPLWRSYEVCHSEHGNMPAAVVSAACAALQEDARD